jgi:hypothetical protein
MEDADNEVGLTQADGGMWARGDTHSDAGIVEGPTIRQLSNNVEIIIIIGQDGNQYKFLRPVDGFSDDPSMPTLLHVWRHKPGQSSRKTLAQMHAGDWIAYTDRNGRQSNGVLEKDMKDVKGDGYLIRCNDRTVNVTLAQLSKDNCVVYDADPFNTPGTVIDLPVGLDLNMQKNLRSGMYALERNPVDGTVIQGELSMHDGIASIHGHQVGINPDTLRVWTSMPSPDILTLGRRDTVIGGGYEYFGRLEPNTLIPDTVSIAAYAVSDEHGHTGLHPTPMHASIPLNGIARIVRDDPNPMPDGYAHLTRKDK